MSTKQLKLPAYVADKACWNVIVWHATDVLVALEKTLETGRKTHL